MNRENTKNIIKKILIILVIIIILGVILTMGIGNYFVNYAIARSGDGGNREIKDDSKIEVLGEDEKIIENKVDIPVGKWVKCDKCKEIIYKETIRENMNICPNCGGYFRMHINRRLESIIDEGTYQKFDLNIDTTNPLNLEDYTKKIKALREKTGLQEAVITFRKGCK